MTEDGRLYEYLGKVTNNLAEHFDAVQIIASKVGPDGNTTTMSYGSGNWHARVGMCQAFTDKCRGRNLSPEDD